MKISVVTVSHNSVETIADTLRSVAEQSFPDVEHIVVDGASSDGTVDVVRKLGAHVKRLVSEPDHGIYDAMNKGLRLATGDVVGFLNADDTFAGPEVVTEIARAFQQGEFVDATFGDLVYVDKDDPGRIVRYWRSGAFSRSRLAFGWMPPHPTLYVRRERLAELGGFDTRLRIAADYDFMLRCLAAPRANPAYIRKVLVHMRTGGASNRSLHALVRKSREDLAALRANRVGGLFSLACKNVRKVPQLRWSRASSRRGS